MSKISQADAKRYKATLEALDSLLTDEINARFGHPYLSPERAAGKSRIYSLLSVPRNMARNSLRPPPITAPKDRPEAKQ